MLNGHETIHPIHTGTYTRHDHYPTNRWCHLAGDNAPCSIKDSCRKYLQFGLLHEVKEHYEVHPVTSGRIDVRVLWMLLATSVTVTILWHQHTKRLSISLLASLIAVTEEDVLRGSAISLLASLVAVTEEAVLRRSAISLLASLVAVTERAY